MLLRLDNELLLLDLTGDGGPCLSNLAAASLLSLLLGDLLVKLDATLPLLIQTRHVLELLLLASVVLLHL